METNSGKPDAVFRASDGIHGVDWKSDGTEIGTEVLDINTGPGGSSPDHLVAVDGLLFFEADDGVNGAELWASNGTPEGTWLYTDLTPVQPVAFPWMPALRAI